jgi:hypothetical protein
MSLEEGELSRRGAIVAAALVSTGVLVSVGGEPHLKVGISSDLGPNSIRLVAG